jgi:hypothetical protein
METSCTCASVPTLFTASVGANSTFSERVAMPGR